MKEEEQKRKSQQDDSFFKGFEFSTKLGRNPSEKQVRSLRRGLSVAPLCFPLFCAIFAFFELNKCYFGSYWCCDVFAYPVFVHGVFAVERSGTRVD